MIRKAKNGFKIYGDRDICSQQMSREGNKLKKITLQWRITLLTALVLAVCTGALTAYSILNAEKTFVPMLLVDIARPVEGSHSLETGDTESAIGTDDIQKDGIIDAVPVTKAYQAKRSYDNKNILFCIGVVAIGTAAVYWVTGRALRPVRQLSRSVSQVDENNLSSVLPEAASRDEVRELTRGFNHMLRRLEAAFHRQKRFTASAAHELKTPLSVMKAGIQVLSMDQEATVEEYRENARLMEANIDRLSKVVEDLLLLASADEGNKIETEAVDLGILCETICSEMDLLYQDKKICWKADCGEIQITGNPAMLYRALFNLIENAFKYNFQNGSVEIVAKRMSETVRIFIADSGPGISGEHLPLIFDAFYRVDDSRSRKIAGSGLGLALVKSILELHGGTVKVESTPGHGTRFIIELPV